MALPDPRVPAEPDPKHRDQAKDLVPVLARDRDPVLELDLVPAAALHRDHLVPAELGYLLVAWDFLLIFIIW